MWCPMQLVAPSATTTSPSIGQELLNILLRYLSMPQWILYPGWKVCDEVSRSLCKVLDRKQNFRMQSATVHVNSFPLRKKNCYSDKNKTNILNADDHYRYQLLKSPFIPSGGQSHQSHPSQSHPSSFPTLLWHIDKSLNGMTWGIMRKYLTVFFHLR